MAHGSPRARGEGKEGGDGDSRMGLARWSGGAPARSPEPRTGPMAVAAVDRDLEQSESEVERARERDGCAAANDGVSIDAGPTRYPAREREDLVQLGFFPCNLSNRTIK